MQKAAALIFLSASNLTEEPVALQTPQSVLSKTRWRSHSKMSLVSVPGSVLIKKMLMKSPAEALWWCPDLHSCQNKYGQ